MLQREEGVAGMEEDIMAGKVAVEAVRCYHCDEVEHISRDCPNPHLSVSTAGPLPTQQKIVQIC